MATPIERWKEKRAKYRSTLVYLDEPQVVLLDHGEDAKIIGVAIHRDGYQFPFLGAEISFSQWERYLRQFVDLRYLFLVPKWKHWFIFDLANQSESDMIPLEKAERADYKSEENLPAHGFWARSHTEDNPVFEKSSDLSSETFNIDGTWDPSDISQFFGRINDLYSFFLGLKKFRSARATHHQKRGLVEAFTGNTLHSGFNYVNFYGELRGLVGFNERLAMPAIVKRSPGYVRIEGLTDTLAEVNLSLSNFSQRQDQINKQYQDFHKFLSRSKLLRERDYKFRAGAAIIEEIKKRNILFAECLGVDLSTVNRLTGYNYLAVAKILLAHSRRLDRYFTFFIEGRAKRGNQTPLGGSESDVVENDLDIGPNLS